MIHQWLHIYITEYRNDTRTYTNYITGGSYSLEYDSDNHFEFTFTPDSETDFIILGYNSDYCIHYLPINMFKTTINDNILIEYDAPLDTSDGLKISYYTADEDKYIIEPLGAISVKDLDGNSLTLQNSSSDPENSWRVENKECIIEIVVNIDDNTSITYKQKVNLD